MILHESVHRLIHMKKSRENTSAFKRTQVK